MTEAQAVEAMSQAFITGWASAHPLVPYTLDNEEFSAVDAWARFTIVHTTRVQGSMGPAGVRRFETRGQMAVQLFGNVDAGARPLALLADSVRSILEATTIAVSGQDEPVHTYAGSTGSPANDGTWRMVLVTVPFVYVEQR